MVETPVGFRCPKCAHSTNLPTFNLVALDYVKAFFAGLGAATACGVLWLLVQTATPYMGFFNFFLAAGVGYGIGEAMSISINRKRGRLLRVLGGLCVVVSFIIGNQFTLSGQPILVFNFFNLLAIAAGVYLAILRL